MIYLLDTNAWITYIRQSHSGLVRKVLQANPHDIRLCSVVLGELYYGVWHCPLAQQARQLRYVEGLRQIYSSIPFDDLSAERYGQIRATLAGPGKPIGPNDTMIAAIALTHGLILVTHNTKEFGRVAGLTLEDWQTP